MDALFTPRIKSLTWNLLRVVAGLCYLTHGLQKWGMFGGLVPGGGAVPLASLFGAAGIIETTCGVLIILGLLSRPAAFIASGEVAVAYFKIHAPHNFFPIQNRGEVVVLFCFIFLFIAAHGPGSVSLDALLRRGAHPRESVNPGA